MRCSTQLLARLLPRCNYSLLSTSFGTQHAAQLCHSAGPSWLFSKPARPVARRRTVLQPSTPAEDGKGKLTLGGNAFPIEGTPITALLRYFPPGEEYTGEVPLAVVTAAYIALLDVWGQARAAGILQDTTQPVLVLDEANVLTEWGEEYRAERRVLLRFFIYISKVQCSSHVWLVTSDSSFLEWVCEVSEQDTPESTYPLCCCLIWYQVSPIIALLVLVLAEIGGFFHVFVIGDFAPEDARQFLDKHLQQLHQPEVPDEDWGHVYKVCGGNAGTLAQAADFFEQHLGLGGWQPALRGVARVVWHTMRRGYMPKADAAYIAADYATAVKAILESPYNAVEIQQLDAVLDGRALDAMVQAHLLALRPYSYWANDIDPAAFGPGQCSLVVTAASPLHLDLMRRKKDTLLAALDSKHAQPGVSNDRNRPPNPTSAKLADVAKETADVTASIQAVESQIKQVVEETRQVQQGKGEGWQADLAHLQNHQQYLAVEKEQLQEQLRQLQEKKSLLLKRMKRMDVQ